MIKAWNYSYKIAEIRNLFRILVMLIFYNNNFNILNSYCLLLFSKLHIFNKTCVSDNNKTYIFWHILLVLQVSISFVNDISGNSFYLLKILGGLFNLLIVHYWPIQTIGALPHLIHVAIDWDCEQLHNKETGIHLNMI